MRKRYICILLLPAILPSCQPLEQWIPTGLLTQPLNQQDIITSDYTQHLVNSQIVVGTPREVKSYPEQQILLTPVERPDQVTWNNQKQHVFDTVPEPALIQTSLLENRKDRAMQRRSFPSHIFDKMSSIVRKFMPKVNKKPPRQGVRNVRTYGGYRKPQYRPNQNSIVPIPSQPELTVPTPDSVNFTPIDQPIVGPFPPMGNGYETVIIIQTTDANQESFDSSKGNGLTTESPTTTASSTNIVFPDFEDDPPDLTPEEEGIVEEYMDIIYDLINTRINSIDDGLEPDLSLDIDPPPNGRPSITPRPRTTPSTPNFVDYDGLLYPDFVLNVAAPATDPVQDFGPFAPRNPPPTKSLFDEDYPLYPDFVVQQEAPRDSNTRDTFPELSNNRLNPTLNFNNDIIADYEDDLFPDYEDDLYPDFSVNFEASTDPRRPQLVPQVRNPDGNLVPDFTVDFDLLDPDVALKLDENGNQVMVKTEVFPSADPEYVYEVEYEYTEDADLVPDFELTELDQNNKLKKRVKMKNVDVLGLLQKQNQFSFANLISHSKPTTTNNNKKQRRKNKFQRQRKKNRTPYQEFLESRFQRLEKEKQSNNHNVIQQTQTTSRRPKAQSDESVSAGDYMFSLGTDSKQSENMTWTEARMYCRRMGRTIISMDDPKLMKRIMRFMKQMGVERIWVGGRVGRSKHGVFWEDGSTQTIQRGQFPWAKNGRRGPQPDGDSNHSEDCVALVFKSQDVSGLHDASCKVRLPTACQLPN